MSNEPDITNKRRREMTENPNIVWQTVPVTITKSDGTSITEEWEFIKTGDKFLVKPPPSHAYTPNGGETFSVRLSDGWQFHWQT